MTMSGRKKVVIDQSTREGYLRDIRKMLANEVPQETIYRNLLSRTGYSISGIRNLINEARLTLAPNKRVNERIA